jgi:hypothetical protein
MLGPFWPSEFSLEVSIPNAITVSSLVVTTVVVFSRLRLQAFFTILIAVAHGDFGYGFTLNNLSGFPRGSGSAIGGGFGFILNNLSGFRGSGTLSILLWQSAADTF